MALFFMSSLSFANAITFDSPGCFEYAIDAAYAEQDHYGGDGSDMVDNANWYYSLCEEAGGVDNILDPIFL